MRVEGKGVPTEPAGDRAVTSGIATAEQGDPRDPGQWPAEVLSKIERIMRRSRASAGSAVQETFGRVDREMTAGEFVLFWNETRMKAMATVGNGAPHIAPVHAEFLGGQLRSTVYENALRRRDLVINPRVALTTWGADGAAAIVYGRAREIPDSLRESRPGATGRPRRTVALEIEVTRIYAMKPRRSAVANDGQ